MIGQPPPPGLHVIVSVTGSRYCQGVEAALTELGFAITLNAIRYHAIVRDTLKRVGYLGVQMQKVFTSCYTYCFSPETNLLRLKYWNPLLSTRLVHS